MRLRICIVAPAGLRCLGSLVLRLRRHVLPAVMSAPPSKGGLSARTGTCRRMVSWLAGTAPARVCAAGGRVWSTQQGGGNVMVYQQGDRCSGVSGGSWRGRFGPRSRSELDWRHAAICQALCTYAGECPWSCPESCLRVCQVNVSCLGMAIFKHINRDVVYM